jgi:hypothetical protein
LVLLELLILAVVVEAVVITMAHLTVMVEQAAQELS